MNTDYYTKMGVITLKDNLLHSYFSYISWEKDYGGLIGIAKMVFPYTSDIYNYWTKYDDVVVISASMEKGKEPMDSNNIAKFSNNVRVINEEYNYSFIGRVKEVKPKGEKVIIRLEDIGWKFLQYVPKEFRDKYVKGHHLDEVFQSMCEFLGVDFAYTIEKLHEFQFADDGFSVQQNGQVIEEVPSLLYEWGSSRDISSQGIPEDINTVTEGQEDWVSEIFTEVENDVKSFASGIINRTERTITNATGTEETNTQDEIQTKIDKYQAEFDAKILDLFAGNAYYDSEICSNVMDYGRITQVETNTEAPMEAINDEQEGIQAYADTISKLS